MRRTDVVTSSGVLFERGGLSFEYSRESLEKAAEHMAGLPVSLEHNPFLMPLGKIERAWTVEGDDGRSVLQQTSYLVTDDAETFIHQPSGIECARVAFEDSAGRFSIRPSAAFPLMSVDISALKDGSFEALKQEVRTEHDNLTVGFHDRQSQVPVPIIEFAMNLSLLDALKVAIGAALLRAGADGTLARWTEESARWFKDTCVSAFRMYRQHKNDDAIEHGGDWVRLRGRIQEADGLVIELLIPSENTAELTEDFVEPFIEQVKAFGDLHTECDKMVFAYFPEEKRCEFRYALTKSGDVIGSQSCYEQSVQPHRLMLMSMQYGTDTLWTLATKDNGQLVMDLYSIADYSLKYLGWLHVSPEQAATFQEMGIPPNDGVLRPLRQEEDGKVRLL